MSDATPKFLKEALKEPVEQGELDRLEALVIEFLVREARIEELEQKLKEERERFRTVEQDSIPTLLLTHGLSEVRLKSGKKVIVKEQVSASVPVEKEAAFFTFLKERNEEDIIKLHFHFGRMSQDKMLALFGFLTAQEYEYDSERGVHPQTLKKYFKELLGLGDEEQTQGVASGKYMRKEDVQSIANVFTFFNTKIK